MGANCGFEAVTRKFEEDVFRVPLENRGLKVVDHDYLKEAMINVNTLDHDVILFINKIEFSEVKRTEKPFELFEKQYEDAPQRFGEACIFAKTTVELINYLTCQRLRDRKSMDVDMDKLFSTTAAVQFSVESRGKAQWSGFVQINTEEMLDPATRKIRLTAEDSEEGGKVIINTDFSLDDELIAWNKDIEKAALANGLTPLPYAIRYTNNAKGPFGTTLENVYAARNVTRNTKLQDLMLRALAEKVAAHVFTLLREDMY